MSLSYTQISTHGNKHTKDESMQEGMNEIQEKDNTIPMGFEILNLGQNHSIKISFMLKVI